MHAAFHALLAEPRAANPPMRVWRDYALVAVLIPVLIVEVVLRDDVVGLPLAAPLILSLIALLPWRRQYPMRTFLYAFGSIIVFDLLSLVLGWNGPINLGTSAVSVIFMYALYRWASGREMAIGFVLVVVITIVANVVSYTGLSDVIGGIVVMALIIAVAVAIRYRSTSRQQAIDQVKINERTELARELHDTVAHHVSAIVIQAQAGRFLARSNSLEGAADALAVIEEEAARTLTEMRSIVGVLRDGSVPSLMAPQHGIADIASLASTGAHDTVPITVAVKGDVDTTGPAVGAAVYRLAQESITNAVRHARNATRIHVEVDGSPDAVHLTVTDDGDPPNGRAGGPGFGIVGMNERASSLGGRLTAGPAPERGWIVQATVPRGNP